MTNLPAVTPEDSKHGPVFGKSTLGNGPPMTMWSDNGLTFGDFDVKNRILSWGFWILRPRP